MDNTEEPDDSEENNENEENIEESENSEDNIEVNPAEDIIDPIINQHRKPQRGDMIKAVINNFWMIIKLTSN